MSSLAPTILAALATLAGVISSGLMLILLLASSPNSTAEQAATIRNWMLAVTAAALLGVVGAIWALVIKRPWHAAGIGAFPVLFCVASFVMMWRSQR